MNRDDILRMAREACPLTHSSVWEDAEVVEMLERFAALVAAHEREECAKLCNQMQVTQDADDCADAIRARK